MVSRDWLLVLVGAVGFIVLSHQIPVLRQLGSSELISLEDIEGIDLQSLKIVREKGII
ncbi:MAG: hypothetical protein PHP08_00365 [Candidatus Dojkabacteria bacterium]|nr:hypothetical protein [Candidatus Dojkabacteria bacterium]